jgi:hypothetical protein
MQAQHERDAVLWLECALLSCLLFLFFFNVTCAAWNEANEVGGDARVADGEVALIVDAALAFNADRAEDLTEPESNDSDDMIGIAPTPAVVLPEVQDDDRNASACPP